MKLSQKGIDIVDTNHKRSISYSKNTYEPLSISFFNSSKKQGIFHEAKYCYKTYLNLFPQHKRKLSPNFFNFLTKKQKKRAHLQIHNTSTSKYTHINILNQIKAKEDSTGYISSQKFKVCHTNFRQKINQHIKTLNKLKQTSLKRISNRQFSNKINQSGSTNVKFDRKKYLYYRYRKKSYPEKNILNREILERNTTLNQKHTKPLKFLKVQNLQSAKESEQNQTQISNFQLQKSFYGVISANYQSFSEVKCKLIIEPTPKQKSYSLIDRKSLSKTTREMRNKKIVINNCGKIFPQAIHFKSRRADTVPQSQKDEQNLQRKDFYSDSKIMGWNEMEQKQPQQQDF